MYVQLTRPWVSFPTLTFSAVFTVKFSVKNLAFFLRIFVEQSSTNRTLPSTPPPKFGNDCWPRVRSSSRDREQFTSVILKVLIYKCNFKSANLQVQFTSAIYKCNLQASLNHRANACSCFFPENSGFGESP
jgi:hypothetical protein